MIRLPAAAALLTLTAASAPEPALAPLAFEQLAPPGTRMPRFKVDAAWPRMPGDLLLGQVSGVAVGPDDSVWVVHRPHSLTATDTGLAQTPPTAVCCKPAPPVVHFAQDERARQRRHAHRRRRRRHRMHPPPHRIGRQVRVGRGMGEEIDVYRIPGLLPDHADLRPDLVAI